MFFFYYYAFTPFSLSFYFCFRSCPCFICSSFNFSCLFFIFMQSCPFFIKIASVSFHLCEKSSMQSFQLVACIPLQSGANVSRQFNDHENGIRGYRWAAVPSVNSERMNNRPKGFHSHFSQQSCSQHPSVYLSQYSAYVTNRHTCTSKSREPVLLQYIQALGGRLQPLLNMLTDKLLKIFRSNLLLLYVT